MVRNWQSSAKWWQVLKCIFWDILYNWVNSIYFCFNTKLNWRVCTMGFRAGQYNRICLLNSDRLEPTAPLVWTKKLTLGSLSTLFSQNYCQISNRTFGFCVYNHVSLLPSIIVSPVLLLLSFCCQQKEKKISTAKKKWLFLIHIEY